jgi:hypothetical protein
VATDLVAGAAAGSSFVQHEILPLDEASSAALESGERLAEQESDEDEFDSGVRADLESGA